MGSDPQAAIRQALDQLWVKFLPQIEERLALLEGAGQAFSKGCLSDAERSDAASAAHKLAGVLGTFGIADGTELARQAEILYSGELPADSETRLKLVTIAVQLAQLVRARPR